jgi:DNA modification methylase
MATKVINQAQGQDWALYHGDCVEVAKGIPDNSLHYSCFSPPFASLYVYSNSTHDMGNCKDDDEFAAHFQFLIKELYRALMPGRLVSFHCMNLPTSKVRDGYIGIRDFRGDLIRAFQAEGFIYHSEVVIWKDPVIAMQRTKALGLLHKQVCKDSAMSRQGIPDYLVTMRKPGVNPEPCAGPFTEFVGEDAPLNSPRIQFEKAMKEWQTYQSLKTEQERWEWQDSGGITEKPTMKTFTDRAEARDSINIWQRYASPVWMDIDPGDTLQFRSARDNNDERHICPLQLQVIDRALQLWTNPGDVVLSPFAGIGSEGYSSLRMGRKFVGIELKESYYKAAVNNLANAEDSKQGQLNLLTA